MSDVYVLVGDFQLTSDLYMPEVLAEGSKDFVVDAYDALAPSYFATHTNFEIINLEDWNSR